MSTNVPLTELIAGFKEFDLQEKERAAAAVAERSALFDPIRQRIMDGETTGDVVEDFMICCVSSGLEPAQAQVRMRLKELQATIVAHPNELVLVVRTEKNGPSDGAGFSFSWRESRDYRLGQLTGTSLLMRFEDATWSLPTAKHVSTTRGTRFMYDGPIHLEIVESASFYQHGVLEHIHLSIDIIVGNAAIREHFTKYDDDDLPRKMLASLGLQPNPFLVAGILMQSDKSGG